MPEIAVYPGSFDPPTNGHVDIIDRGSRIFDHLVIGVLDNPQKKSLFSSEERVEMLKEITAPYQNVEVRRFRGLLVSFLEKIGAKIVVRGLRASADFEYEFQMALMNRELDGEIDTIFLMPSKKNLFISSQLVKEIAKWGGPLHRLVPPISEKKLREHFTSFSDLRKKQEEE